MYGGGFADSVETRGSVLHLGLIGLFDQASPWTISQDQHTKKYEKCVKIF